MVNKDILSREMHPLRWGKRSNKRRRFSEIPIVASTANGFGDVMNTLKLAEGLSNEFPDTEVCVYFQGSQGYDKVGQLYPSFNSNRKRQKLNGIIVAQEDGKGIKDATERQIVGLYSLMVAGPQPSLDDFLMNSGVNLYLQEYDAQKYTAKPGMCFGEDETGFGGLETKTIYVDNGKRKHIVIPTGFDPNSFGIHLDISLRKYLPTAEDIERKNQGISPNIWTRLVHKDRDWLKGHSVYDYVAENKDPSETSRSTWGFCYGMIANHDFEKLVQAYLRHVNDENKTITIFDLNASNGPRDLIYCSAREKYRASPFKHIFLSNEGYSEIVGEGRIGGKQRTNVKIIHLGNLPHDEFLEFLGASELPPVITGDASLSEVVSLGKPFIYDAKRYKSDVIPEIINHSETNLSQEDSRRIKEALASDWNDKDQKLEYSDNLGKLVESNYQDTFRKLSASMYDNGDIVRNVSDLIKKSVSSYPR